ncbi:hypothetical protein Zmor_008960 [Zophobas morio]|uniref:Uncharacterized protein n=1 Tax=Zophobas morio TaxID=2755281 RepID=A0AA38HJF9_9CUCU|nr:hypothetical protein Zmor_008960 [Zophobas morio]
MSERARFKLQSKFNERAEKINIIAKELKLIDSFKETYIDLSNITPEDVAAAQQFTSPSMIKSGGALEQATTAFASQHGSSTDYDPNIENIYNQNSTATDGFKAPNFSGVSEAPMPGGKPETFVVPTTVATEGFKVRAEKQKQFLQAALSRAIRMG